MPTNDILLNSAIELPPFIKGKVRDTYHLGNNLLIVVTDRISAFDVVLPCGIPEKGRVLNLISAFWFEKTASIIPNHVIETVSENSDLNSYLSNKAAICFPDYLKGRSMVVKKTSRIPIECVVRGYLAGSGWSEYKKYGTVCGIGFPSGMQESQELPIPIFTPTTKADSGHDLPISHDDVVNLVGKELAEQIESVSLSIYSYARDYAKNRGFIIADTKMEFGILNGKLILIDELLTPDSSRFWDIEQYKVGRPQDSFDKQPVRDWLENSGWNKEPPGPVLPDSIIADTQKRYKTAYTRLTGNSF